MKFSIKKSDLNFKVYTSSYRPTEPGAENDIAIITSIPMPNWILSPDKPSGIPRSDGDVWIQYSTKGDTFNALKNNTMLIATIKAWQYVDGAWADREAVNCQNGEWVDWWNVQYIFKDGEFYFGELSTTTPTRLYVEGGELKFAASAANGSWGYLTEQVDLSKFTKMKAKIKQTNSGPTVNAVLSVTTTTPSSTGPSVVKNRTKAYVEITVADGVVHELETSVATLSGLHWVEFAAVTNGALVEAWFE